MAFFISLRIPLEKPEMNHVMVCERWGSFGHKCLILLNLSIYSRTFSLCLILIVLNFLIGISSSLFVPKNLQKDSSSWAHVTLSVSSISRNQSAVVPTKAKGKRLIRLIPDPSLLAQHANLYLARYLTGSSLPL